MKTLSFKNDPAIKDALIARMDKHIELDELLQGATGSGGKGCTVWCSLNNGDLKKGYDHAAFVDVLGLPEWLARLHDTIYEGLTVEDSKWFSKEWVRAVPVGRDLDPIKWLFVSFILKENMERVLMLKISDQLKEQVVNAIRGCLKLCEDALISGIWDESAERSAASAAWSAAWSAASAAWSAAWSAASAAKSAESAAKSAESAAWSAASAESAACAASAESAACAACAAWSAESAESAAWSAERSAASAANKRYAVELLRLFNAA